jgi:uncharacterized protein YbjT (DUF2867 family)
VCDDDRVAVVVLGSSGRTGRLIVSHAFAAGHPVVAVVRRRELAATVTGLGRPTGPGAEEVQPVVADLLGDGPLLSGIFEGHEAVINAAGSYEVDGAADRVNFAGAVAAIEAAKAAGVPRFIHVSCMFADRPDEAPDFLRPMLAAKRDAEQAVRESGLAWTIVRPGPLADAGIVGHVSLAPHLDRTAPISREDVAAVVGSCLFFDKTAGYGFDVSGGSIPLLDAFQTLLSAPPS